MAGNISKRLLGHAKDKKRLSILQFTLGGIDLDVDAGRAKRFRQIRERLVQIVAGEACGSDLHDQAPQLADRLSDLGRLVAERLRNRGA